MIYGTPRELTMEFDARGRTGWILLWPKCNRLVSVEERMEVPVDALGVVHDKSSWARRFVSVQNTLVQPGWRGHLTLEVSNRGWMFRVLRRGDAMAQIVFHEVRDARPYDGRYQDQPRGPVRARLEA